MRKNYSFVPLFMGLLLAHSAPLHAQAPATKIIDINHVKAQINSDGLMFSDGSQGQFIPTTGGLPALSLVRNTGLWVVSLGQDGNIFGAIQNGNSNDFAPGAINGWNLVDPLNGVWSVSCAEINQHNADFLDNGVIDNPNPNVAGWPARGNPFFAAYNNGGVIPDEPYGLAGYFDRNEDAYFNNTDGEYPSIDLRSCPLDRYPELLNWFPMQDQIQHPSGLGPVSLNVQTQVMTFKTNNQSLINNAVFVIYKLIYVGDVPLDSCYFGISADFDIGNPNDDFMGVDADQNLVYAYNGDATDENGFGTEAPVMAMDLLRGPLRPITNDSLAEIGLTHHVVLNEIGSLFPVEGYYNILAGRFPDGSPAPNNGLMYPGNPNNANAVSEKTLGNTPGKRQSVSSFGPFSLHPGAINEIVVAYYYVHTPGATALQNVQTLLDRAGEVQALFDNCFASPDGMCDTQLFVPEHPKNEDIALYPNPADATFTIESKNDPLSGPLEMRDMLGRLVYETNIKTAVQKIDIPSAELPAGMYTVRLGGYVFR